MTVEEYMELKKKLSEALVGTAGPDTESVKALAEAFDVSMDEAMDAIREADNDLRTAMKILRMKSL